MNASEYAHAKSSKLQAYSQQGIGDTVALRVGGERSPQSKALGCTHDLRSDGATSLRPTLLIREI
jgi:hypothetical protein